MLASFLLALREGIEAALIVGIVLGAVRKLGRADLVPALRWGLVAATLTSVIVGVSLTAFGLSLEAPAEQVFEGIAMLLAAGVLTWMIFWMSRQARYIKADLETGVRRAAMMGGSGALFGLAFLAVVREGIELALFLAAAAMSSGTRGTAIGGIFGLGAAAVLGWAIFASTIRLDMARFFRVTGAVLLLFAAGLVGHAVHEFNEVGWIPAIIEHVWNLGPVLNEGSLPGAILQALAGYNSDPSLTEALAYAAYFGVVLITLRRSDRKQPVAAQVAA